FDHRPSDGIIYHKRNIRCSFRNEHASDIGIIIDRGGVGERQIAIPHVGNASLPAPDHDLGWDLVAALTTSPRHSIDCCLRRGQPEKNQSDTPTLRPAFLQPRDIRPAGACSFEGEALAGLHEITHPRDHKTTSLWGRPFGVEW